MIGNLCTSILSAFIMPLLLHMNVIILHHGFLSLVFSGFLCCQHFCEFLILLLINWKKL